MEDTYGKILWEGYGLKYYGGTRTRTGLICKTDVGLRELKKARSRREDLLFAHGTAIFICWKTPCLPKGWRRITQGIL